MPDNPLPKVDVLNAARAQRKAKDMTMLEEYVQQRVKPLVDALLTISRVHCSGVIFECPCCIALQSLQDFGVEVSDAQ